MIDPNRGTTEEVLRRLKEGSEERFRTQLLESIRLLLNDFQMTWDDLAEKLKWFAEFDCPRRMLSGDTIKRYLGQNSPDIREINEIAHVFSAEPYIIFRPRKPYTQT